MSRHFTPDEANAALAELRPLVEEMVARRRALVEAQERRAEIGRRIAGNGGGIDSDGLAALDQAVHDAAEDLAASVQRIGKLGVVVKDPDIGLVDFPALRRGEEVLLCWRLGEDEVGFWHGIAGGFAGRRPLPLD